MHKHCIPYYDIVFALSLPVCLLVRLSVCLSVSSWTLWQLPKREENQEIYIGHGGEELVMNTPRQRPLQRVECGTQHRTSERPLWNKLNLLHTTDLTLHANHKTRGIKVENLRNGSVLLSIREKLKEKLRESNEAAQDEVEMM